MSLFQTDAPLSIELPPKESKTDRKRGAGSGNKLTPSSSLASFVSAGIVAPTSVPSIPLTNTGASVTPLSASAAAKRQRVQNDSAILLAGGTGSRAGIIPSKTSSIDYLSSLVHHQHQQQQQQLQQFSSSLVQAHQTNNHRHGISEHAHRLTGSDFLFSSHTVEDLLNHGYSASKCCCFFFGGLLREKARATRGQRHH